MVDLHFAQPVRRLARDDLSVPQIARRLHCDEAAVTTALCMPGIPVLGAHFDALEPPKVDGRLAPN